jgi:hypothetical protein
VDDAFHLSLMSCRVLLSPPLPPRQRRVFPPCGGLQRCARAPRAGRASVAMRARSRGARAERARALARGLSAASEGKVARLPDAASCSLPPCARTAAAPPSRSARRAVAPRQCTAAPRRAAYRAHPPPGAHAAALWSIPRTLLMPLTGREPGAPAAGRCAGRRMAPVAGGGGWRGTKGVSLGHAAVAEAERAGAGGRARAAGAP